MSYKKLTSEEAALLIKNGDTIGFSGFTAAGTPHVISQALAKRAEAEHAAGRAFKVSVFTGASTNDSVDGALARANAIDRRTPYQSHKDSRKGINSGDINYFDMHLSQLAQNVRYGFLGKIDVAIIEAAEVTEDGEITLGTGVGAVPTFARLAKIILIELNSHLPKEIKGIHDIYEPLDPPYRKEIPVYKPSDRIGSNVLKVDPAKIACIVEANYTDGVKGFAPVEETTMKIGENVTNFLVDEMKAGRIPASFLPIQSGVGNIANAVLACMGKNPDIPPFEMYTEVVQDAVVALMKTGKCKFASTCSLTVSDEVMKDVFENLDFYKQRLVLRPGEISNNPEVVRRLGLITMNTALEADIFGNVNSTHVVGTKMMNGIGGSGDFTRNAYISIFTCPSVAKEGKISAIVPFVSHVDHSEHSVDVLITEQGVADLRGKSPRQKAELIIENCVNPEYKQLLREYLKLTESNNHTPHDLNAAFAFHNQFNKSGDMRDTCLSKYAVKGEA
ncbi:MAG: succinate CoA transferase [Bacteroidales bacterium]|nr:succinate CoA transferase [Bacteroidales bacterium]